MQRCSVWACCVLVVCVCVCVCVHDRDCDRAGAQVCVGVYYVPRGACAPHTQQSDAVKMPRFFHQTFKVLANRIRAT